MPTGTGSRMWSRSGLAFVIGLAWAVSVEAGPAVPQPASSAARQELSSVLRQQPNPDRGRKLFNTCAACHQDSGVGAVDGTVPAVAGQYFGVIVRELVGFREDRRWDERMQHFTDHHHLKDAQAIADVAAYISRLPVTHSPGHGSGASVAQGASLYERACASCHGTSAEGDALHAFPRLAGQHYEYLLRVLGSSPAEARPGFERIHQRWLRDMQRTDMVAVADYLSRLGP